MNVRLLSLLSSFPLLVLLSLWVFGQANSPPVAVADTITVHGSCGHPLSTCPSVLLNDSDPNIGDQLFATTQIGTPIGNIGQLSIFGPSGTVSFSVNPTGITSGTGTASYQVCDSAIPSLCTSGTVSINVFNQPPTVASETYTVHGHLSTPDLGQYSGILANDSDSEGDPMSVSFICDQQFIYCDGRQVTTTLGSALLSDDGRVSFGATSLVGSVTITYRVTDSLGSSSDSSVTFNVVNNNPVPGTDYIDVYDGSYNSPSGHSVLSNDSDPDGDYPLSTAWVLNDPGYPGGTFTMNDQGRVNFSANANFTGTIVYPYTLKDSLGLTSSGTIVFKVHPRDYAADAGKSCPPVGKPVNVATGNMWLEQTDYLLPGLGENIEIRRFYNSVLQTNGLFGFGWSTQYDESLVAYGDKMLRLNMPDGRAVYFARANSSLPFINDRSGDEGTIQVESDSSYKLTLKDGRTRKFAQNGRLLWLEDRNSNRTTLNYDSGGFLIGITDTAGRVLTLNYSDGKISYISDSVGTIASYEYFTATTLLKKVTYSDGSEYKFEYDSTTAAGKILLKTVKDALDNILETHAYDSAGRALTSEIEGGKEKYTFNYANWQQSSPYTVVKHRKDISQPEIETRFYFKREYGMSLVTKTEGLCSCGGGGSEVTESFYDEQRRLARQVDALSNQITYAYDANGNLASRTDRYGTEKFTYNSFGQVLTYKDRIDSQTANVNTAVMTYNSTGNQLTFTDALGKTTTLDYPTTGNKGLPKSITDARSNKTEIKWFASGLLDEVEDPYAKKTKFTYDARGRTKTVTNALNHVTTYNYFDDTNRKVEMVFPNADKITYKYDIRRLLESVTDERGKITGYEFDPQYRLKKITDPLGHFEQFGYDDMSNMITYTDALGNVTNYEYDDFNRVKKIVHPAAVSGGARLDEEFEYDKLGRIKKYTDTAERFTQYAYDDATRTNTVTNAEGEITTTKYNQRFQTIEVKDALNQIYTFNYDPLGRLLSQTRAGGTMSFEYDNVGNRKKRTDYAGRVTNYTYDNLNRLKKIEYEPGGTGNDVDKPQSTYNYDDVSRLTSAVNEAGTVSFNYDNRGRVINTTDVFGRLLEYEYERTPTVNQKRLKFEGSMYAVYNFDDAGRLASLVNSSDSTTTTFGYDNEDKITSRVFPNGVTTTYEYYNNDLLKRLKDVSTTATLFDRQYAYNSANQIGTITDLTNTRTFDYDDVDRLTGVAVGSPVESYTFDDVGNRTSSHLSATYGYQSGKFNQMSSTATATMSYDANGSMVSKSEGSNLWRYTWDYENRLTRASTRKQNVRYKYDALGRRVERNFDYGKERTKYTHDGLDVVVDDDYGTLTKYQNGPGIDNKLRAQTGSSVNYFLTDHLGSTNGLADPTGAIMSSASYDSFGNKTGNLAARYQFTGREYDPFTNQYFYRARFYDSNLGRFTSEDPIGFEGGDINLYGYVGNRPLAFTDSLGLDPEWDQQVWRAQQDLLEALAPAIRYGIGYGDTTLFSLPKYLRQWQGIDDPTLPCYTSYQAGEWTAIVVQLAIGGAAGLRAAGGKAAGREFSHWIPKRHGGPRSILNGNFVPIAEHALTDPFRYRFMPRVWKAVNPMLPPIVQQWHRIPRIYKGVGAGAGAAATSSYLNNSVCECK